MPIRSGSFALLHFVVLCTIFWSELLRLGEDVYKRQVWDDYETDYTIFSVCGIDIRVLDDELGALREPTSLPIMSIAAFTGIGLTSQKRASQIGSASNCILQLPAGRLSTSSV